jgi:hypothetical protein
MNCHDYADALDAHVDGVRLPAFEAHLAGCASCQALVADFGRLRQGVAALDEHVPPPRVWARIASAIEQERLLPWWKRALAIPALSGLPAAATIALLVGGALWIDWRTTRVAPEAVDAALPPAEQRYEDAIAGLQQIASAQDDGLDPATRAVLQRNLAVIDRAITESRAALSSDPANALAHESLLDALDTKVALLQNTVTLMNDIAGETADVVPGTPGESNQ